MPCWNYLPAEIKQHVVKKLDFMSRHSLKNTSRLERHIVNSTTVYLPRVRFGYKEEKCLIVIYTEIDKFLRLEFEKHKNGTVIYKSENSYDSKKFLTKFLPDSNPSLCAIEILKSLLAHRSIKINAMEWDVSEDDLRKFLGFRVIKILDGERFRMDEIVMRVHEWDVLSKFPYNVCNYEDLKTIRQVALVLHDKQGLAPTMAHEMDQFADGKRYSITFMRMYLSPALFRETYNSFIEALRTVGDALKVVTFKFFDKNTRILHERQKIGDVIVYPRKSECGALIHNVHRIYEKHLDYLGTVKCGLGSFCKRCSDPFEYWYYQHFPRRVFHETFWTDFILNTDKETERKKLHMIVMRHEKLMEKIHNRNKKKTPEISSWGFEVVSNNSLMHTTFPVVVKNINRRKFKRMGKKIVIIPNDVTDKEETDEIEAIEESVESVVEEENILLESEEVENLPESKMTLPSLQHFVFFILLPISVSIVFYLIIFVLF